MLKIHRGLVIVVVCAVLVSVTATSAVSSDSVMIVRGTVSADPTLDSTAGWRVVFYSYREPPSNMPHLPPIGHEITEVTCDKEGRYEFRLNIHDLLGQGITKIVVFAHPNPSGGPGWQVLEVNEGTYTVNLVASKLPALPSVTATQMTRTAGPKNDEQTWGARMLGLIAILAVGLLAIFSALLVVWKTGIRSRQRV